MSNIQKPVSGEIEHVVDILHNGGELVPFQEEIFLISLNVAGTSFIKDIENLEDELKEGVKLDFYREAKNPYDDRAILIKYLDKKIGYVPQGSNEILANLMDAGKYLYGVVVFAKLRDKWLHVRFNAFLKD